MMILKRFSAMTLMLFVISGIVFAQGFMGRSLDHQKARAVVVNLKSIPQQAQGASNPADVPPYLSEVPAEQLEELKERDLVQKLLPHRQPQASVKDVSPEGITQVTAPNLLTSFSGIGFNSGFPPDPVIAAGPNHIMLVVNSIFWIVSKTGSLSQVPIFLATWVTARIIGRKRICGTSAVTMAKVSLTRRFTSSNLSAPAGRRITTRVLPLSLPKIASLSLSLSFRCITRALFAKIGRAHV